MGIVGLKVGALLHVVAFFTAPTESTFYWSLAIKRIQFLFCYLM